MPFLFLKIFKSLTPIFGWYCFSSWIAACCFGLVTLKTDSHFKQNSWHTRVGFPGGKGGSTLPRRGDLWGLLAQQGTEGTPFPFATSKIPLVSAATSSCCFPYYSSGQRNFGFTPCRELLPPQPGLGRCPLLWQGWHYAHIPVTGGLQHNHIWVQVWKFAVKYKTLLVRKQLVVLGEHHSFLASPFQWEDLGSPFFPPKFLPWWKAQALTSKVFLSVTGWLIENSFLTSAIHTGSRELLRAVN